jgi:hypothetical protein
MGAAITLLVILTVSVFVIRIAAIPSFTTYEGVLHSAAVDT